LLSSWTSGPKRRTIAPATRRVRRSSAGGSAARSAVMRAAALVRLSTSPAYIATSARSRARSQRAVARPRATAMRSAGAIASGSPAVRRSL
jgi:hypothetical protein